MRISDWSSDVCSSDLPKGPGAGDETCIHVETGFAEFENIQACSRNEALQEGELVTCFFGALAQFTRGNLRNENSVRQRVKYILCPAAGVEIDHYTRI